MKRTAFLLAILVIFLSAYSFSIELSLEENKAESGTVGYVNIEKVFKLYPLTKISKDEFKQKISERQKILDQKIAEIEEMKGKLIRLKQEKEFAESLKNMLDTAQRVSEINAISQSNSSLNISTNTDLSVSTPSVAYSSAVASNADISSSSNTFVEISTFSNIKEDSRVEAANTPSIAISTVSGGVLPTLAMPGVGNIPLKHFKFSVSTSPAEIEYAINSLNASILAAQSSLEDTRKQFDKEMYEYQDEETEKILGRIYIKLKELSIKEGVSVVVDKKSILFGHKAVDLTDKLIQSLKDDY